MKKEIIDEIILHKQAIIYASDPESALDVVSFLKDIKGKSDDQIKNEIELWSFAFNHISEWHIVEEHFEKLIKNEVTQTKEVINNNQFNKIEYQILEDAIIVIECLTEEAYGLNILTFWLCLNPDPPKTRPTLLIRHKRRKNDNS